MIPATGRENFALHHNNQSYIYGAALALLVSIGMVGRIIIAHDWRLVASLEIGWIMIAVWIYVGVRYQVLWQDGAIVMKALGKQDTVIPPEKIMQVAFDTSERARIGGIGKAAQRIKIAGKDPAGETINIFVSLGHFLAPDVLRLMRIINDERPDLTFPREWIEKSATSNAKA